MPVPAAVARNQESALRTSASERRQRLRHAKASLHHLVRRSRAGSNQRHLQLVADRGLSSVVSALQPDVPSKSLPRITQRHVNLSIAREPREKGFVDHDTAGQRERLIAD